MVAPLRTPRSTVPGVAPFQGVLQPGQAADTPWWLKQQGATATTNAISGGSLPLPVHDPGSYRAPPPIWRSDAGTSSGFLNPSGGQPDTGYQLQSSSAYPHAGMEYAQQQSATPGQDGNPTGRQSRDAGLAAIYGQPQAPKGPTPEESRDAGLAAIYGQGKPTTTINVNGMQVPLPIGWSGVPGTFRFSINGAQEDALTFLARRLTDAAKRGLNVQDPKVVYDEIARIRDDMLAAGVKEADLDAASGMAGLSKFVRGQAPGADGRPAAPAAPANPNDIPGVGAGGGPGVPGNGSPNASVAAIAKAAQDQTSGFNILMKYLTGSDSFGGGPFDDFMQSFLGPILTSVINAQGEGGTMPTNIDSLLGQLRNELGGGTTGGQNLYQHMSALGRAAMQKVAGRGNIGLNELASAADVYAPLTTFGMNRMNQSAFYRQQADALRALQNQAYSSPTLGAGRTDWNTFFNQSPFYNQYYR